MPSFFICASRSAPRPSTPTFFSSFTRSANSTGPSTFAGSLTRSRARMTPSAIAPAAVQPAVAAGEVGDRDRDVRSDPSASARLPCRLVLVEGVGAELHAEREIRRGVAVGVLPSGRSKRTVASSPCRARPSPRRRGAIQSLSVRSAALPVPTTTSRSKSVPAGARRSRLAFGLPLKSAVAAARLTSFSTPSAFACGPRARSSPTRTDDGARGLAAGLGEGNLGKIGHAVSRLSLEGIMGGRRDGGDARRPDNVPRPRLASSCAAQQSPPIIAVRRRASPTRAAPHQGLHEAHRALHLPARSSARRS